MKRQIDLLFGGILLAAPVVLSGPVQSTSLQFAGGTSAFSESYLLTSARFPAAPDPDTYLKLQQLGMRVIGPYVVQSADTLWTIAKKFASSADSLRSTNRLDSVYMPIGTRLIVHNGTGVLHQVREVGGRPETLREIAAFWSKESSRVIEPKDIVKANKLPGAALLTDDWLSPGETLFIPGGRRRFTDFLLPVDWMRGKRLFSSNFGMRRHPILRYRRMHTGVDMPRPHGTPVKASQRGVVVFADWRDGYGRLVIVRHMGGIRTWYGHLSAIKVQPGQKVRAGQVIGNVGSSGLSTGPHLHFEVRDRFGRPMNPKKYLL